MKQADIDKITLGSLLQRRGDNGDLYIFIINELTRREAGEVIAGVEFSIHGTTVFRNYYPREVVKASLLEQEDHPCCENYSLVVDPAIWNLVMTYCRMARDQAKTVFEYWADTFDNVEKAAQPTK